MARQSDKRRIKILAFNELPGMGAPRDLWSRTRDLVFSLSADAMASVRAVHLDSDGEILEITKLNCRISLR